MKPALIAFIGIATTIGAHAQERPRITAVVSAGDFYTGVALGGLGTIFGVGLSDGTYQASTLPLPKQLGSTEVFVCPEGKITEFKPAECAALQLVFVSPTQINFLMFSALPTLPRFTGTLAAVVRAKGVIDEGAASGTGYGTQLTAGGGLLLPAPRIFVVGYDCLADTRYRDAFVACGLRTEKGSTNQADRGAVTDKNGKVLMSSNPAKLGEAYTIWLTGLGQFIGSVPRSAVTLQVTNVPVYGYPGDTWKLVSPTFVGPSPEFPGLYQVNFVLPISIAGGGLNGYPPLFPCGTYNWEVSLSLSQSAGGSARYANLVQIPISVKPGDAPCS